MRKKFKRIIPFVLVGVLASSFVMTNYNKAREAKAAFVVDDLALMIALFAMCGITYTGLEYYYANGQWLDENDSPVAEPDTQKQLEGLLDRSKKHWDDEVRKKAIAQGLIDEDGNILNGGSGGTGDDDDNKFPNWEKLKEKVAKNGGNVALAVSSLLPFVALYGYGALNKSGADLADKFIDDGVSIDMSYIKANTVAYAHSASKELSPDGVYNIIFYSNMPVCLYNGMLVVSENAVTSMAQFDKSGNFVRSCNGWGSMYGGITDFSILNYGYVNCYGTMGVFSTHYPSFTVKSDVYNYFQSLRGSNGNDDYFNPVTIGQDSSLRDAITGKTDYPTSPIHSTVKLPSIDKLKDFIKNLKNTSNNDDDRQKVVDDFTNDLTNPDDSGGETPNPNPNPDNPDSGGGGGTGTDNPDDTDKSSFTRDLRLVFPFCIPFDLVDCIRLFNAEPETPKIDVPMHFPIVNVDYTWTIDLKDFDGVAKICRSMFLIMFIIGLVFATRPLIRG